MIEQKLTVSREQAVVRCEADGSATLTSKGKGPTLWCSRGEPWVAVPEGEQVPLSDGDLISLDVNDPDGAIFSCERVGAQTGGYQQEAAMQPGYY